MSFAQKKQRTAAATAEHVPSCTAGILPWCVPTFASAEACVAFSQQQHINLQEADSSILLLYGNWQPIRWFYHPHDNRCQRCEYCPPPEQRLFSNLYLGTARTGSVCALCARVVTCQELITQRLEPLRTMETAKSNTTATLLMVLAQSGVKLSALTDDSMHTCSHGGKLCYGLPWWRGRAFFHQNKAMCALCVGDYETQQRQALWDHPITQSALLDVRTGLISDLIAIIGGYFNGSLLESVPVFLAASPD